MKRLLLCITTALVAGTAMADIQDPPMNDQGPTRKFGRACANLLTGFTEVPVTMSQVNDIEGNSAAATYGLVKGLSRFLYRGATGVVELVTFPFPTYRRSFRPPYRSNIPWIHGGFEEFPPELGFQSRKPYCANSVGY
jgi:putative exosortase-associated protein (TIGR04073 family)